MKTSAGTLRMTVYLLSVLLISAGLTACGGGGGNTTSPGTSGPATVSVSIASATSFPDGTTSAPSTATLSPNTAAPPSPEFNNLFVTVTKLALIPSTGEDKSVTDTFSPVTIDLLHLNSSTGDNVATLLNKFTSVPAGEYSKIRVYYDNVVGQSASDNTLFHPTANSHFDVHFMGGNLVIPVTSEIHPQGGIRFYSVEINVVGLKHVEAGNSGNFLLRPQVFAEVVSAPVYIVSGEAQNVNPADNTFDIDTGGTIVTAVYSSTTTWIYIDNTVLPVRRSSDAGAFLGASGLDNGAYVEAIGTFTSDNVLLAREVDVTLRAALSGKVYLGWNNADNTITLRFAGDNVVSVPNALRNAVFYDNAISPYGQLSDLAIMDNVFITARGYATGSGIKAYWISIGEPVIGP